ncbi:MAG: DedA family protein [Gemmatimonadetes bacterium]|nr:DedA family protein [Gemmatimonadota bacterium]MBT5329144.1 DedA family protein [Gemmatimonadota bacterium]MBT5448323.1 DedA family protein [Gemmatimonadota bacterium]MBT5800672.1 DedA family protein [Gemmatimonadota bacterium]MBT6622275.1 DedA family protein [Gemmatimonadota bacterium]
MEFLEELIQFLRDLGAPGLMGLAFVDSAGIPTGGGPDWVLLVMVSESQLRMDLLLFVPAAVLGSSLGCLVPYHLGRRGGHLLLDRFEVGRQASVRDKIDRYGLWAVAFSVVAPPPYPMKLFILSAGVFGMPLSKFVLAVVMGRTLRYSMVGYLAVCYGERATELLRTNFATLAAVLAALAVIALLVQTVRNRNRA